MDESLSGVNALQTLPCLNRAHPQKHDYFVLEPCAADGPGIGYFTVSSPGKY
jgi:hypothetical protein